MNCRYCDNSAIYYRKVSNEYLCKTHFIDSIEEKIRKTVRKYNLFTPKEKVVVGLSGGKDSLTLLYNVIQLQQRYPKSPQVEAILIDEGIQGYRAESVEIAKKICEQWKIPLHIIPIKEKFGANIDDLIPKLSELNLNPCTVCGTVRRRLLNEKALELNADKLAIGHNLDDVAETFIQNIVRNDLDKILMNPPFGNPIDPEHLFVPRIKPLMAILESEIMLYCYYQGFPIQATPCPYVENFNILRKSVLHFLNDLELRSAEIKYNILTLNEELIEKFPKNNEKSQPITPDTKKSEYKLCKLCQAPMGLNRETCYYCELKNKLILKK